MMNEFWTTLLNSPVLASIFESLFVCGVVLLLQHLYDKKLENHKEHVQKKIDEHQIQFSWWHQEKAKAIKTIYANLSEIRYLLQKLHSIETNPNWKKNQEYYEKIRQETYLSFLAASENNAKEWLRLRLFFDKKDDDNISANVSEEADFFEFHMDRVEKNEIKELAEKGPEMLRVIEAKMTQLRDDFQITLGAQKQNAETSSPQAPVDTSSKNEVKS